MDAAEQLDHAPAGAGAKRARDETAAAAAAPSSSSSSSSAELLRTPAPASAPAPLVRLSHAEHFNTPLLKFYYQHLFPFKQMTRWLSYGNGASALPVSCPTNAALAARHCHAWPRRAHAAARAAPSALPLPL